MIITVTPNPSIDRTVTLSTPLVRGAVHRAGPVSIEAGGKGVNVARALALAGIDVVALLPAAERDPILSTLAACRVPFRAIPTHGQVRTNLAITESDGTTTKVNEPGMAMGRSVITGLTHAVLEQAESASWVVLAGSLPPGVPDDWYADVTAQLLDYPCKIAVDTSDAPLAALAAGFDRGAPDLIKPNSEELADLAGATGRSLESALAHGDPQPAVRAAHQLIERGARTVLATLGGAGAILVSESETWLATTAPITPRSTVGAGDAALAGYLRADIAGADAPHRLQMAVAYGSAAAALPGSALPEPSQINLTDVTLTSITSLK